MTAPVSYLTSGQIRNIVVDTIVRFHDSLAAEDWMIAPLLARLAAQGCRLADIGR